jgi:hypothetical protein
MNFLLLILAFNGSMETTYFPNQELCENSLLIATDNGNYKHIKIAQCIDLTKR